MKSGLKDQRGGVLPLVAASLPVFLSMVGLVVDSGLFALRQVQLNSAADSAALAGASAVDLDAFTDSGEIKLLPGEARRRANLFAAENYPGAETTVTVSGKRVTVDLTAGSETVFLRIFGLKSSTINARGDAQAG